MKTFHARPWLALYDRGLPPAVVPEYPSPLAAFRAAVRAAPDAALIHFFDTTLAAGDVDRLSSRLARGLGVVRGARVAVCLQNVPQFAIALLAIWKAGAVMVPLNPMLKPAEAERLLADAGAEVVVAHHQLAPVAGARRILTTDDDDFADIGGDVAETPIEEAEPTSAEVAVLTYTSGTTGPPKGAMNTHGNIVDRKKDQINASGFKVWPREVEDVLYSHPAVREAAVVGVPDDYRGETVKAFVALRPGAALAPAELIAFARERLAAYKAPREVELVDELPKTASGKILRREFARVPLTARTPADYPPLPIPESGVSFSSAASSNGG